MKKKKQSPFSLIVLLSLTLIALISLTSLITPKSLTPPNPSLNVSFRNLITHPRFTTHNPQLMTLLAVGDIMLGRYCNVQMLKQRDFLYPFLKTADLTSSADIAFGNLETPFVENCPADSAGMVFCARPEAVEGLKFAGFDILSLANNHILNYGQSGLEQTKKLLATSDILYSPLSSSNVPSNETMATMKQLKGLSFGFLSFDLVTYPQSASWRTLIPQISLIFPTVDILIVSLHWGAEYQKEPTIQQKQLAHEIIDAGAKIIIGHHPHVIQSIESYKNGLIFYSLGNFVFDQPWSEETKKGQVAKIIFEGKEIKSYELIPIYIHDFCQPKSLD